MYMDSLEFAKQHAEDLRKEIEKCRRGEQMWLIRKKAVVSNREQASLGEKRSPIVNTILMMFRRLL